MKKTLLILFVSLGTTLHAAEYVSKENEIRCLAKNVFFEARGEPISGQFAVAHVTMNRLNYNIRNTYRHRRAVGPTTICGVVFQRSRRGCQFSWVCKLNRLRQPSERELVRIEENIVLPVIKGQKRDNTQRARFFHSTQVLPNWAHTKQKTTQIGAHIFYR